MSRLSGRRVVIFGLVMAIIGAVAFAVVRRGHGHSIAVGIRTDPTTITPPLLPSCPSVSAAALTDSMNGNNYIQGAANGKFVISYSSSPPPAEAVAAINSAFDRWATILVVKVPIRVTIGWGQLGGDAIANTSSPLVLNQPGVPAGILFTPALAQQLSGVDASPDTPNMTITLGARNDWYMGANGTVPSNYISLVATIEHEIGHGLGIISGFQMQSDGGISESNPTIFDTMLVDSNHVPAISQQAYPEPSAPLNHLLISGKLLWGGPKGVAAGLAVNGEPPVLYTPGSWTGSSVAHLDSNTYPNRSADSLLTPVIHVGTTNYDIGTIIPGILSDEGWTFVPPPPPPPPVPPPAPRPTPRTPTPSTSPTPQPTLTPASPPTTLPLRPPVTPTKAPIVTTPPPIPTTSVVPINPTIVSPTPITTPSTIPINLGGSSIIVPTVTQDATGISFNHTC